MIRFAAAMFLLLSPPTSGAFAADVRSVATGVDQHYNRLHSLQAEFIEVYHGSGMDRTESGTLWLAKGGMKKPGKMRWEYRSPREKLFVSDGRDAWFYVPGDLQARKASAAKLDDLRSPLAFLLGKTKLEKELQGLSLAPDVTPLNPEDVVVRQSLRDAAHHYIFGIQGRHIRRQRQSLQLLFQLSLPQQKCQRRTEIIQFRRRRLARLQVAGDVKPRISAVAHKQFLPGRTVFPAHLARFFHPGFFQPKRSRLRAFDAGAAVNLGKFRLQAVQMVVVLVHDISQGLNAGFPCGTAREQARQSKGDHQS